MASSHQFLLPEVSAEQIKQVLQRRAVLRVELKWFGADQPMGSTSRHDSWRHVTRQDLPETDRVPAGQIDTRLPLTFSQEDCDVTAAFIRQEVGVAHQAGR